MPTSAADSAKVKRQRLQAQEHGWKHDPFLNEREWLPLWLAGPVVSLVAILGLIGLLMLAAEMYVRFF